MESDLLVNNSLIDFYAKCRYLKVAHCKFSKIKQKDLVSWNAMLAGYALEVFARKLLTFLMRWSFRELNLILLCGMDRLQVLRNMETVRPLLNFSLE